MRVLRACAVVVLCSRTVAAQAQRTCGSEADTIKGWGASAEVTGVLTNATTSIKNITGPVQRQEFLRTGF